MCISFCHKQGWLYLNHQDCQLDDCQFGEGPYPSCHTCPHYRVNLCFLTNTPHPETGCCHHNTELDAPGCQLLTTEMMALWSAVAQSPLAAVLPAEGVLVLKESDDGLLIDLDNLALPYLYGTGTEHISNDDFDWSDWFGEWGAA